MSVVVFAAPSVAPPPKVSRWMPYVMSWEGSDGSVWDLSDPRSGIVMLRDGVTGMHFPGWDRYTSDSPALPGSRFRGTRVLPRDVTWAIHLYSDESSVDWVERDRAFWRSFDPNVPGTWSVTSPDGQTRRLPCRLISAGDYEYGHSGSFKGWATYPVNLVADDPFWLGSDVSRSWSAGELVEFFDPDDSPPFHISQKSSYDDAVMTNPGDVAAWPVWTVVGPSVDAVVTVDGGQLGLPDLSEGQTLVIDTDPARGTAVLDGVEDVSGLVLPWDPRPVPAGGEVPVSVEMSQLAELHCRVTPKFYRAI